MSMIVVTGGTGFIARNFVKIAREQPDTWATPLLRRDWNFRYPWPHHYIPKAKYFIHFGANVKARQSIKEPREFLEDNVIGTFNVLELARRIYGLELFVYISSAEALGGCEEGYLDENAPMRPSNPYAATKGCGELLTYTFFRSYKLPAIIVRTQCVWSMEQTDLTKAVPIIKKTLEAFEPVKIYTRNNIPGSRQWIEVDKFCKELLDLLPKAVPGETYHIIGEERNNLQMVEYIAEKMNQPLSWVNQEISPTHEHRYALKRKP